MQVVDAGIERSLLARLADALVHKVLCLLVQLLDASGMDAAVGDEVLERHARGLAADGVEAREDDGLGRVVDHEVDAGNLLERADVASLAADDAALEVVGGNVDGGDGDLAGLIGGATLDGGRDDLAGGLVGLVADAHLGLAQDLRLLADGLGADAGEQFVMGIVLGEAGDALELGSLAGGEVVQIALALVELALEARELMLALVERLVAMVEGLLALHDAVLERLELLLALLLLSLGRGLEGDDLLLRGEHRLLASGLGIARGLGGDALGGPVGLVDLGLCVHDAGVGLARRITVCDKSRYRRAYRRDENNLPNHACSSNDVRVIDVVQETHTYTGTRHKRYDILHVLSAAQCRTSHMKKTSSRQERRDTPLWHFQSYDSMDGKSNTLQKQRR